MNSIYNEDKNSLKQMEKGNIANALNDLEKDVIPTLNNAEAGKSLKKKFSKKVAVIGAILITIIAVVVVIIAIKLTPSKFDKVQEQCVQIAGTIAHGKNYFTIDTYPDVYENMDSTLKAFTLSRSEEKALKAIQYANSELGFSSSLYSQMIRTSALMGRQAEENGKYIVSWFYNPDTGLEVTYTEK